MGEISTFNRLLTLFAIEKGAGGPHITDLLAPRRAVLSQGYSIPKFVSGKTSQHVSSGVGPDGKPNILKPLTGSTIEGRCERRAYRDFIRDEDKASPTAYLYADREAIVAEQVAALQLEQAIKVRDLLVATESVSGHNATPTVKWNDSGPTIKDDFETAKAAASINAGKPITPAGVTRTVLQDGSVGLTLTSAGWLSVIPSAIAQVMANDPDILVLRRYTDPSLITTSGLPPQLWDTTVVEPKAVLNSAAMGQAISDGLLFAMPSLYLVYVDPAAATAARTFTAMLQPTWSGVTPPYAVIEQRDTDATVKREWVSVDIYDDAKVVGQGGIYALKTLLA